jgi:predicted nucleic acid-binding protein
MREKVLPVLFDTDVLVWYFRGLKSSAELIAQIPLERRFVSSVCIMELIQGCRSKGELKAVTAFIRENFHIVHCDKTISERAISLLQIYALSHGLRTVDAIISSTVLVNKALLVTGNSRHFDMIKALEAMRFEPRP